MDDMDMRELNIPADTITEISPAIDFDGMPGAVTIVRTSAFGTAFVTDPTDELIEQVEKCLN